MFFHVIQFNLALTYVTGLELGIWNSGCQSLVNHQNSRVKHNIYVVKLPKSVGARHYCPKILPSCHRHPWHPRNLEWNSKTELTAVCICTFSAELKIERQQISVKFQRKIIYKWCCLNLQRLSAPLLGANWLPCQRPRCQSPLKILTSNIQG